MYPGLGTLLFGNIFTWGAFPPLAVKKNMFCQRRTVSLLTQGPNHGSILGF